MPGIDKAAFLKRISGKAPAGEDIPGAAPESEMDPEEHTAEEETDMTCGEQLVQALGIEGADVQAVDDALREAVRKYGKDGGEEY